AAVRPVHERHARSGERLDQAFEPRLAARQDVRARHHQELAGGGAAALIERVAEREVRRRDANDLRGKAGDDLQRAIRRPRIDDDDLWIAERLRVHPLEQRADVALFVETADDDRDSLRIAGPQGFGREGTTSHRRRPASCSATQTAKAGLYTR